MQSASLLSSVLVVACAAQSDAVPTTTITVDTAEPAALVAYRDWSGDWRTARATSATTFEIDVTGAYLVAVVCQQVEGVVISQVALTPTFGPTVELPCGSPRPPQHEVSFSMVQPGFVTLERSLDLSSTGDWEVHVSAPAGTHEVVALGSEHVAVRAVSIERDTVLPPLDLAVEGIPLVASPVVATNATARERVSALLQLRSRPTDLAAQHATLLDLLKVAPPEAQLRQHVTVVAADGARKRQLRRPFQLGDSAAFALPASIGPLDWSYDAGVTVAWTSLPEHQWLRVEAGAEGDGAFNAYTLEVSASFIADTGITRATIETDLPGFEAAWLLDETRAHTRQLSTTRARESGDELSSFSELVPSQRDDSASVTCR